MNKLQKTNTGPQTQLKRLVCLLTMCGFTTSVLANTFPTTPLHLQDETTTTTEAGVKPNIMLMIDDSGSMKSTPNGGTTDTLSKQRIGITQNALNRVLDTYQTDVNWGIQTLWDNGSANYIGFTDNYKTIKTQVGKMTPNGGTPTTARYFQIQDIVRDNIKNRCQKSYIVLMSDGDSNLSCYRPNANNSNNVVYNIRNFTKGNVVGATRIDSNYKLMQSTTITQEHCTGQAAQDTFI